MGTALVTGATSGLGLEIAWQLAQARHDLVLVARTPERLRQVAEEMRQFAGVQVETLQADLSKRDELELVAERLRETSKPVGLLVNNAGFGLGQRFVGGDLAREEDALNVMVRAVMVASHAAAGAMVERGRGAILNVSSMTAHTAMGTYAAHKAWVRRGQVICTPSLRYRSANAVLRLAPRWFVRRVVGPERSGQGHD